MQKRNHLTRCLAIESMSQRQHLAPSHQRRRQCRPHPRQLDVRDLRQRAM